MNCLSISEFDFKTVKMKQQSSRYMEIRWSKIFKLSEVKNTWLSEQNVLHASSKILQFK